MMKFTKYFFIVFISLSCKRSNKEVMVDRKTDTTMVYTDSIKSVHLVDSQHISTEPGSWIQNWHQTISGVTQHELVDFAKTMIGTPYKYASTEPSRGFDCSGFITYVFNYFSIHVPRSSIDFTNVGQEINLTNAKEGDLILFTGTADSIRIVGHMGIVTENTDTLKFIHSTSGHANGVTISAFTNYYKQRFVKVIRVFPE